MRHHNTALGSRLGHSQWWLLVVAVAACVCCCFCSQDLAPQSSLEPEGVVAKALWSLWEATNGHHWIRPWITGNPICSQAGVTCVGGPSGLLRLDLSANNLQGSVPASLFCAEKLLFLDLHGNELTGALSIPTVAQCEALGLPPQSNSAGSLTPHDTTVVSSLEFIDMSYNSLSGSVPAAIMQFTNLTTIIFTANSFQGQLPEVPEQGLTRLRDVWFDWNQITGCIPQSWQNLPSLQDINLRQNDLSCSIGDMLAPLLSRELDCVAFVTLPSTSAPPQSHMCNELRELDLSGNSLTGRIPTALVAFRSLSVLDLHNNMLEGPLPPLLPPTQADIDKWRAEARAGAGESASLTEPPPGLIVHTYMGPMALSVFRVDSNIGISGPVPNTYGNLPYLESLYAFGTSMKGKGLPNFLAYSDTTSIKVPGRDLSCSLIVGKFRNVSVAVSGDYNNWQHCQCDAGFFGTEGHCVQCPEGCSCAGDAVGGCFPSYRRNTSEPKLPPLSVLPCPRYGMSVKAATACNPSVASPFICATGHRENSFMCSECDDGFFTTGFVCTKCGEVHTWLPLTAYILMFLLLLMFLWRTGGGKLKNQQGARLMISMWYLQVVGALVTGGSWVYFEYTFDPTAFVSGLANFTLYAIECFSSAQPFTTSLPVHIAIPPGIAVLAALLHAGMTYTGYASKAYTVPKCLNMTIMVWDLWYFPGVVSLFKSMSCYLKDPANDEIHLLSHPQVVCATASGRTGEYITIDTLSTVVMLLYVVGYPLGIAFILFNKRIHARYKDSSDPIQSAGTFPMLFVQYKPELYYWRLVTIFKKLCVAVVVVFTPYFDPAIVYGMLLLVFQGSAALDHYFHPYAITRDNRIQASVTYGLMLTCLAGLVQSSAYHHSDTIANIAIILGVVLNCGLMMVIILVMVMAVFNACVSRCRIIRSAAIRHQFLQPDGSMTRVNRQILWQSLRGNCCMRQRRPEVSLTEPLLNMADGTEDDYEEGGDLVTAGSVVTWDEGVHSPMPASLMRQRSEASGGASIVDVRSTGEASSGTPVEQGLLRSMTGVGALEPSRAPLDSAEIAARLAHTALEQSLRLQSGDAFSRHSSSTVGTAISARESTRTDRARSSSKLPPLADDDDILHDDTVEREREERYRILQEAGDLGTFQHRHSATTVDSNASDDFFDGSPGSPPRHTDFHGSYHY